MKFHAILYLIGGTQSKYAKILYNTPFLSKLSSCGYWSTNSVGRAGHQPSNGFTRPSSCGTSDVTGRCTQYCLSKYVGHADRSVIWRSSGHHSCADDDGRRSATHASSCSTSNYDGASGRDDEHEAPIYEPR